MKPISKTQASLKLDTHNYKITENQIKIMNTVFQLHAIHSSIRKIMITTIKMKTPKMISTSSPDNDYDQ